MSHPVVVLVACDTIHESTRSSAGRAIRNPLRLIMR
jgi:hypothetical protein